MEVEIDGIVIDEPKNPMEYCIYVVRSRGKEYMIVSYHVQAVKDYILKLRTWILTMRLENSIPGNDSVVNVH